MTAVGYFRWSIWMPLVLPLVAIASIGIQVGLGQTSGLDPVRAVLMFSLLIGGLPYLVFAAVGSWILRGASARRLRNASLLAPFMFGLFMFLVVAAFSMDLATYGLSEPVFVGGYYAAWSLAVGCAYVALIHLGLFLLRRSGRITE